MDKRKSREGGSKRVLRVVEMIKTAIIALLTIALLANISNYISLIQNVATGGLDEIPWEKLRVFENGGIIPDTGSVNPLHVSPVYIAMSYDGRSVCSVYDRTMTDTLFEGFRPYLADALSGTVRSGGEELWNECVKSAGYVYMKLAGELPLAALRVFLTAKDDGVSGEGAAAFVSELFLIPTEGERAWYAVLRDIGGKVTILSPPEQNAAIFNTAAIKAYTDNTDADKAKMISYSFLGDRTLNELGGIYSNNISDLTLPGTFPVLGSFTSAPKVRFVSAVGFESGSDKLDRTKKLLQVLGYNPEKTSYYKTGASSRTYVDEQGSLLIRPDGEVSFVGEKGIHLSKYLGSDSTSYSFAQIISCADILMDSLENAFISSASDSEGMSVKLCSVEASSDDGVTVRFAYFSDGYRLLWGEDNGEAMASVTVKNNAVMGVSLQAGTVEKSGKVRNLSPAYSLAELEGMGITHLRDFELCYKLGVEPSFTLPVWTGRTLSGEVAADAREDGENGTTDEADVSHGTEVTGETEGTQ
ncbi:MAG: hypothetical protein AB9835_10155 [Eubacteriales bacterium]